MRSFILGFALMTVIAAQMAYAGDLRQIELIDGGAITAEVLSLSNGIYTVRSASLGTIKIEESKVRSISAGSASGASGPAGSGTTGEVKTLQEKMLGDQEVMGLVQSLQNDPEFQKILEDPEVMKAVNAGDTAALTANPKFMKLMNHSTVQDIQKKVK